MLKVHVKYHLKPGTQADFLAGVTEKILQDAVLNEDGCLKYEYIPAEGVPKNGMISDSVGSKDIL